MNLRKQQSAVDATDLSVLNIELLTVLGDSGNFPRKLIYANGTMDVLISVRVTFNRFLTGEEISILEGDGHPYIVFQDSISLEWQELEWVDAGSDNNYIVDSGWHYGMEYNRENEMFDDRIPGESGQRDFDIKKINNADENSDKFYCNFKIRAGSNINSVTKIAVQFTLPGTQDVINSSETLGAEISMVPTPKPAITPNNENGCIKISEVFENYWYDYDSPSESVDFFGGTVQLKFTYADSGIEVKVFGIINPDNNNFQENIAHQTEHNTPPQQGRIYFLNHEESYSPNYLKNIYYRDGNDRCGRITYNAFNKQQITMYSDTQIKFREETVKEALDPLEDECVASYCKSGTWRSVKIPLNSIYPDHNQPLLAIISYWTTTVNCDDTNITTDTSTQYVEAIQDTDEDLCRATIPLRLMDSYGNMYDLSLVMEKETQDEYLSIIDGMRIKS